MNRSRDAFRMAPSLASVLAGAAIRVGTQNPAKLSAVHQALTPFQTDDTPLVLVPVDVESGVSEQPIGLPAIIGGARNRALAALNSGECALAVGIEDGLVRLSATASADPISSLPDAAAGDIFNIGCAWVTDGEREGHGFSSAFAYPPACLAPALRDDAPIGALFDTLWQTHQTLRSAPSAQAEATETPASEGRQAPHPPANRPASGRRGGNIGMLTAGALDRRAYGSQAMTCALVRFLQIDLYD